MVSGSGAMDTADATPVPLNKTGEPAMGTTPVIVSVPFTRTCAIGLNRTLIVHVAPAARVPPQVPAAAPVGLKNRGEENARLMPVRLAFPVLCSVRVMDALVLNSGTFPNANGPPVTLPIAVTPVPVSDTGDPVTPALAVIVTVPVFPPVLVGEKVTVIVQVEFAANVAPHVPPACANWFGVVGLLVVATTTLMPVAAPVPVLCSVRVRVPLVVPT